MVSAAPTILALETDSAWVVILAVSVVTFVAVIVLRRLIAHPGGFASGVLLALPLALPLVAALVYERAVLPEVAVLTPVEVALRHPSEILHWMLLSDGKKEGFYPYAFSGSAGPWLLLFGASASSFMLCRRLFGTILVHRLLARCTPVQETQYSGRLLEPARRLARAAGLRRAPGVLILPEGTQGAFAVGGRSSRILLSGDLIESLDGQELEAILAHEVAHLEARDVQVVFAAGLLRDMVAWNPIAHLSFRRLAHDRELEADRRAAGMTGAPLALASGLLKVCELLRTKPRLCDRTAIAILRPGGRVTRRVSTLIAISDGGVASSLRPQRSAAYVAAACLVAVLGLQAGARIAHEDPAALAIVWDGPDASSPSPMWSAAPEVNALKLRGVAKTTAAGDASGLKAERKRKAKGKAGEAAVPRHSLQFSEVEGGQFRVRASDLSHYLSQIARRQGVSARLLRWEGQRNWSAVPVFSRPSVGPLGIYRVEPSAVAQTRNGRLK